MNDAHQGLLYDVVAQDCARVQRNRLARRSLQRSQRGILRSSYEEQLLLEIEAVGDSAHEGTELGLQ
jgi:hypothetical protein